MAGKRFSDAGRLILPGSSSWRSDRDSAAASFFSGKTGGRSLLFPRSRYAARAFNNFAEKVNSDLQKKRNKKSVFSLRTVSAIRPRSVIYHMETNRNPDRDDAM